jgi:hypothetical protein
MPIPMRQMFTISIGIDPTRCLKTVAKEL